MAANVGERPSVEKEMMARLQEEYNQLRRKYANLESAHKQALRRLERAEASRSQLEHQQGTELVAITQRFKEKIHSLEMRQLQNTDDFESFKKQLKDEVSRYYNQTLEGISTDYEHQRAAYADLCLQHSILKSEFETIQKSVTDQEEKYRLKLDIQTREFDAERSALEVRVKYLSTELAGARSIITDSNGDETKSELVKGLQKQLEQWRQKYDQLETDQEKRINSMQKVIDDLKLELEEKKEELELSLQSVHRLREELVEEERKRQLAEDRYLHSHEEILKLREDSETLRRSFEWELDEMKAGFAEERAELQKQRDDNALKVEASDHRLSVVQEQSVMFESLYKNVQVKMNEMEQNVKRQFSKEKETWGEEKLALEHKLRQAEYGQQDENRALRQKLEDVQLALRRATWEKEKLAEDLARMSTDPGRGSNGQAGDDSLTKRFHDQEERFADLAREFERYRHRHDQFGQVLQLVTSQCERPIVIDHDNAESMVNDLKEKVNRLMAKQAPSHTDSKGTTDERKKRARERARRDENDA